jgi:coproporphyrinogen III oxidase-like Fe-S oxidoreductase
LRDDAWLNRRTALHDRFLEVAKIGDASRLAYLHGPEKTWTEEEVAAMWARAVRNPVSPAEPLNCVYVHVPFCKSICSFCNYDRLQPSSPLLLKNWLARVLRSIEIIGSAVRPLTFHALYIGGGTPSVLPANMLHELLEALDRTLSWHPRAGRKMEFDPAVMNRERLKVLAAHRIRQLSFGIETLDPEINARHNRGRQGIELIERCFSDLKALGMSDVACDFLLGLEGTTPESMLAEMETVLTRFRPEFVDIFMLTPTHTYVTHHFGGSWEAFWRHIKPFEVAIPAALPELAARTGYRVRMGQGHHMMLERESTFSRIAGSILGRWQLPIPFLRRFERPSYTPLTSVARRPVNVIGLGRSARSVIFGTAAFAARDPEDDPAVAGPASYAGNQVDVGDEARSFLAHLLRDRDAVDRGEFRRIFGGDVTEIIPTAMAGWERDRTATLKDDTVQFVRQDRRDRIRSLLWLVPEEAIEFDLAHFEQLDLTPTGVARLAEAIGPGTALADGHTFEGAEGTRLLVGTPEGETLRLRIAPELREGDSLRLVLDQNTRSGDEQALRRAVSQLRSVITHQHRQLSGRGVPRARRAPAP